jgi:hypothetical protein
MTCFFSFFAMGMRKWCLVAFVHRLVAVDITSETQHHMRASWAICMEVDERKDAVMTAISCFNNSFVALASLLT